MAKIKMADPFAFTRELAKKDKKLHILSGGKAILEKYEVRGAFSTGCYPLDVSISPHHPGLPWGRLSEGYGLTSKGKSTMGESALIECQKVVYNKTLPGVPVLLKFEGDFSPPRFAALGGDIDRLIIIEAHHMEGGLEQLDRWLQAQYKEFGKELPILVDWDSVAASRTEAEMDADHYGPGQIGGQARCLSTNLPYFTDLISYSHTHILMLNQVRHKMNELNNPYAQRNPQANQPQPTGGFAPGFYASVRIEMRDIGRIHEHSDDKKSDAVYTPLGDQVQMQMIKNKVGPPWRKVVVPIYYRYGFDDKESWMIHLENRGIVEGKGGGHYKAEIPGFPPIQFYKNTGWKRHLENPEFCEAVKACILDLARKESGLVVEAPADVDLEAIEMGTGVTQDAVEPETVTEESDQ